MSKKLDQEPILDAENPEWTKEMFATALRFDQLPNDLQRLLGKRTRGPQKAARKTKISVRLSPVVLDALKATGKGWQTMMDEALRRQFVK